ncbi:MAG: hypothetical protein JXA49_05785 [Actinobacteria bacterium]|nr:hypothetical protein [Actinomycetota bacterium]
MNYSIVMFVGVVGEDLGGHIRTGMTITDEALDSADPTEFGQVMLNQLKEARVKINDYLESEKGKEAQEQPEQ